VSGGWTGTCSFASPAGPWILCGAIGARNAAGHLVLTKHCRVSLDRSLHLVMSKKLNTLLVLFSDLAMWFFNTIYLVSSIAARGKLSLAILA
jgi:hypothetical protein